MRLFSEITFECRRLAAIVLTMTALGFTKLGEWLLRLSAWLVDFKLKEIE